MLGISPKLQLAASAFIAQVLRIGTTLVMARFVSANEYGMLTLVLAWPALIGAMGDFGIPASLVRLRSGTEEELVDTGLSLAVGLYLFYGLITIGSGVLLYVFRADHDWRYLPLSMVMATTALMSSIYNVQLALLNRRFHFGAESRQNLIFAGVQACTGITLAKAGFGVFALALQLLVSQIVANAAAWRNQPLRWPKQFSKPIAKEYLSLGGKVSLALYVSNIQGSLVSLLIDRYAGQAMVGMWGRAVQVQQLFAQNIVASVGRVVFPLLCDAQEDPPRMRSVFTRSTVTLLLFACFAGGWLWAGAEDLIRIVLGPDWGQVGSILRVLAFAVPAGALYGAGYDGCYALGRTAWLLRASALSLITYIPMAFLAQHWWGMDGIAWSYVISRYLIALAIIIEVIRMMKVPLGTLVGHGATLLGIGVTVGLLMRFLQHAMHNSVPMLPRFIVMSLVGITVYGFLVWLTQREFVSFALNVARKRKPPASEEISPELPA